jgi:hypothetical protein
MDYKINIPPVLETAILEMGRIRGEASFCPSEVVRWIYPQDWKYFMEDIQCEMMRLYRAGKVTILQNKTPIDPDKIPSGPVRIRVNKTS